MATIVLRGVKGSPLTIAELDANFSNLNIEVGQKQDKTVEIINISSAYTVTANDLGKIINCTSGTFTVSLTAAATLGAGFNCWVWNTSSAATNTITIDPNAAETIDGDASLALRRGEGVQIVCDGANWQTGDKKSMRAWGENYPSNIRRPQATGDYSTAIGAYSTIGTASVASGQASLAINGNAAALHSSAIGRNSGGDRATAAVGSGAMALGGSYASGTNSFAAAVANNTSSYGATGANSVAMGLRAKASGGGSFSFGEDSQATGLRAVAFGYQTVATGTYSPFAVGYQNTASGSYSVAFGSNSVAAQYGKQAFASGRFAVNGDAQAGRMILRGISTSNSHITLTSDGNASGTANNAVTLPDNSTFIFEGRVVARNLGSSTDSKVWSFTGAIRRGSGAGTTSFIGTPSVNLIASDGSAWEIVLSVNSASGGLRIQGIGEEGKTINWVAVVDTVEVTG